MSVALYYLFPLVLIGIAAALGVGSAVYWNGGFRLVDVPSMSIILPAGIVIVALASFSAPRHEEWQDLFGKALNYLWVFCLAAFILGCIFGVAPRPT